MSSFCEHQALLDRVFSLALCLLFMKLKATPLMVRAVGWLHDGTTKITNTSKPPPSINGHDNSLGFDGFLQDGLHWASSHQNWIKLSCGNILWDQAPDILRHPFGFQTSWSQKTMVPLGPSRFDPPPESFRIIWNLSIAQKTPSNQPEYIRIIPSGTRVPQGPSRFIPSGTTVL